MPRFGTKKGVTYYLYSKPVIGLLLVVLVFIGISVFERYQVERYMSARRIAAEEEYQALLERKVDLQERVEYLQGDRGIEEEIRQHFDVAKEGEQVVILLGEDNEPVIEIQEPEERRKWYQFWLKP